LLGTGALLLAGLVLTLVAPKAAHAIAATAVQVENTTSSPVPTQGILPGALFQMTCSASAPNCFPAPSVPAGYVFHATHQYISVGFNSLVVQPRLGWYINNIQVSQDQGVNFLGYQTASTTDYDFYFDGVTQTPACNGFDGQTPGIEVYCILTGYLTH
jgi:hypothetical protein